MTSRISQQQLESYLWGAAVLLRGTIDAGDYKQFIFPLLFYKRLCDVFDEETQLALVESGGDTEFAAYPENHRFQIPREAHWREVRQVANNVGRAIQSAARAIETANPDKLYGIFGDAQWTNKDRLSDSMLRDLIEHFSALELTVASLPEDELGQGYEYLIKKFADDSGHTAAEFYTNRTVVHLMTEMLEPQPGESIYDPTCGSGGMLLSCITHLRRAQLEWRNVRLFGQERNLMTSSIARMNCFLHGIEDFQIVRGDTLSEPKFVEGDRLMTFDVVLANPPYSIKQWDRDAFSSDAWGRNIYGTPPQGRADYAFWQHILGSMARKTGRCAILFPHGVLFRKEESEMRRKLIESDVIECVLGLGPNLFYNSPMEACVIICRNSKPKARKGRILFINAVNEITRERAQSFLTDDHIQRIVAAYRDFNEEPGFTRVATIEQVRKQSGSLNISLYVAATDSAFAVDAATNGCQLAESLSRWLGSASGVRDALKPVLTIPLTELPPVTAICNSLQKWIRREEWSQLPFDSFAESINERVEPAVAADDIYIGLDDLDPISLHIRRSGKGSDVIGTKLRFRKGDIIFGRRRAYQRKLAVAEVNGICSAHAMVVRAKSAVVLPGFLPFLMMSDKFMSRAVEISVGSLSPTINWTTLRREQFYLPPLDQQQRIADVLWAIDEIIECQRRLGMAAKRFGDCLRNNHFKTDDCELIPMRQTGRWMSGKTPSRDRPDFWLGSFPWVSPKDMKQPVINDSEEHLSEAGRRECMIVSAGALLIVIRGMILAHSFPVAITGRDVAFNQDMKALMPSDAFSAKYIFNWFRWATPIILNQISDSSHGTKRLAMDNLFDMKVPKPSLEEQQRFVEQIEALDRVETAAYANAETLRSLRTTFLNRGFDRE